MNKIEVWEKRFIPLEAGVLRPAIVDPLKEDIMEDLAQDILDYLTDFNLVDWHIDMENRYIVGSVYIKVKEPSDAPI